MYNDNDVERFTQCVFTDACDALTEFAREANEEVVLSADAIRTYALFVAEQMIQDLETELLAAVSSAKFSKQITNGKRTGPTH